MFAALFSKIGVYVILGLTILGIAAGGYAYIESQKAKIANLQSSVSTLETSNKAQQDQITHLENDMAVVQKAQSDAQKAIDAAGSQAKIAQQTIKTQKLDVAAKKNSAALQKQLNDSAVQTFADWEALSK